MFSAFEAAACTTSAEGTEMAAGGTGEGATP